MAGFESTLVELFDAPLGGTSQPIRRIHTALFVATIPVARNPEHPVSCPLASCSYTATFALVSIATDRRRSAQPGDSIGSVTRRGLGTAIVEDRKTPQRMGSHMATLVETWADPQALPADVAALSSKARAGKPWGR